MSVIERDQEDHTYYELDHRNADASAEYITPAQINDGRTIAVGRCVAVKQYRCLVGLLIAVSLCCIGLAAALIHQHVSPDTNNVSPDTNNVSPDTNTEQQSGEWEESLNHWTSCSVTCGPGARARVGQCNTNTTNCSGHKIELQPCNLGNCTATRTSCCTCCPIKWTEFQGSCYRVFTTDLNFNDAEYSYQGCVVYLYKPKSSEGRFSFALRGECREQGGHLVHIETSAENTFINTFIKDLFEREYWFGYWIGLDDRETEGIWKWTGTDTIANFTNWSHMEPDGGTRDNCAAINSGLPQWFDWSCKMKRRPVCENVIET